MKSYWLLIIFFLATFAAPYSTAREVIRVEAIQSDDNRSYVYFVDLLHEVLAKTDAENGLVEVQAVDIYVSQARAFQLLKTGQLDVIWAGTNLEREQQFAAIPIPLIGGLLGIRVPVIRQESLSQFEAITSADELKQLEACQGSQWPDTDILAFNGYKVERVISFNLMYSMLQQGRCDYFLRGMNEVYAELTAPANKNLIAFEGIVLRYPLPMYFFVAKNNQALQQRITLGLQRMVDSGELNAFIKQHPTTRDIFPLTQFSQSLIFELTNPMLPSSIPIDDAALWLSIPQS
ncbi:substrate-binding periplasmic protein [Shewanella aestuarii]|uniref:Amino acid ABC transporter substrate-binding protein n=1 Tax=Shewanella aestuarii TaxID=1028752 RepID=A0A6G9QF53_9GAMM|nr:transporter substrate-binding domain-containing protein [Shewanella aestuarii]QIR13150.1 amino acid ABC transporter substrate-binding protein [Shewanella aestuarii]